MKSWPIVNEPSHITRELKRWFASTPRVSGLLTTSSLALATVWCARFYQAEPAPVIGTAKHPVPLCLTVGVTSVRETRPVSCEDVTPRSSLLWAHVPIPLALLCFGSSPRSRSLCRLLPAPAARGIFPTLCGESFFGCLSPYPGGTAECSCLVLPQRLRPSPEIK